MVVVVVPPMGMVVVVVLEGMQGIVVGKGASGFGGAHGGSVVEVLEVVGPLLRVVVVVGVPGTAVVVVPCETVVDVPGVVVGGAVVGGGVGQPKVSNSDAKTSATPGKPPNETWRERTSWQMGSAKVGSSWAMPIRPGAVWETATAGCPRTSPAASASNQMRFRIRRGEVVRSPIGAMPSSRLV